MQILGCLRSSINYEFDIKKLECSRGTLTRKILPLRARTALWYLHVSPSLLLYPVFCNNQRDLSRRTAECRQTYFCRTSRSFCRTTNSSLFNWLRCFASSTFVWRSSNFFVRSFNSGSFSSIALSAFFARSVAFASSALRVVTIYKTMARKFEKKVIITLEYTSLRRCIYTICRNGWKRKNERPGTFMWTTSYILID